MRIGKPEQIPALDGLRGIAILSVMVFHFSCVFENGASRLDHWVVSLASHGSRGVDLFFVLSGFLITRILIRSRESTNCLQSFYMRRVLRIFPVYFLYVFIVFGIMRQFDPMSMQHTRLWPYLAYISNWQKGTGLADPHLTHMWSLAVEEQFYLVWPLLVLLCPPKRLMQASVAICLFALGLRIVATGQVAPQILFRMTPFRADALAGGAIIACIFESERKTELIKRFALPVAGLVFLATLVLRGSAYAHALEFSAIVVGCAALIFFAAQQNPSALRHPLLTAVGKYSYGMYVYHLLMGSLIWSLLKTFHNVVPLAALKWSYFPIASACVFAAAWLSYHYFEMPFLRLKERFAARVDSVPQVNPEDTGRPAPQLVPYFPETGAAA
jgi:peptidoglycan/LPS O-acetylase OafA/YrhL